MVCHGTTQYHIYHFLSKERHSCQHQEEKSENVGKLLDILPFYRIACFCQDDGFPVLFAFVNDIIYSGEKKDARQRK
jgi:hypothetical protein